MISVVLVDDDQLMRSGIDLMLAEADDITVVGEASDGESAVEVVSETDPDVVLMDIRMPGVDGIEATARLTDKADRPRVIILTTFEIDEYVFDALQAGASGFLLKRATPDELVHAVRTVAGGEALLSPSVTQRLIEEFRRDDTRLSDLEIRLERLTDRERDVLVHVARGLSNQELSETLFIAESTVKTHIKRLLMKIEARDRVQAVVMAYQSGLMDDQ